MQETGNQKPCLGAVSPAVLALLNDTTNTFESTSEVVFDKEERGKRDKQYRECLTLLIAGRVEECLNRLAIYNDPLEEYVLLFASSSIDKNSFDSRVFELFVRACDAPFKLETSRLSDSVKRAIDAVFDGKNYGKYLSKVVEIESPRDELQFLLRYFNSCLMAAGLHGDVGDNDKRLSLLSVVEEELVKTIRQYSEPDCLKLKRKNTSTSAGGKVIDSDLDPVAVQRLQELVAVYLFELKVEAQHCAKSEELYWELCDKTPQLQDTLSFSMDNGESYQSRLLSLLRRERSKEPEPQVDNVDHNNSPENGAGWQWEESLTGNSRGLAEKRSKPETTKPINLYQLLQRRWITVTGLLRSLPQVYKRNSTLIALSTSVVIAIIAIAIRSYKLARHRTTRQIKKLNELSIRKCS